MQVDDKLIFVLAKMFSIEIKTVEYETKQLHGGTVGDVMLYTGVATTVTGKKLPFNVVCKTQKKWERYDDPLSWRREYDFYMSDFGNLFDSSFRWAECYHAEMNGTEDEFCLWLEYVNGTTGLELTVDMYERAAYELARFQGRLYAEKPKVLNVLTNLSKLEYAERFYKHYRSWDKVYNYIRGDNCEIPNHLCEMLIDTDNNSDEIFARIESLPIILCHRDYWVTNIFNADEAVVAIDWDTSGWGYLGEDIASLIADEANVELMAEIYPKCVAAYYKGFSEYVDVSHITDRCIKEIILVMFGYRLVEWFLYAEKNSEKEAHLKTLENIYEMK